VTKTNENNNDIETILASLGDFLSCWEQGWCYGFKRHLQHYFSYIMEVSLLVEEIGVPRENHRPAVSHWQTLSH